ncbi:hypothetical protein Trydic_g15128 [Trypoxylus dichotomus]
MNKHNDSVEMYFEMDHECVVTSSKVCSCDPLALDHECLCSEKSSEEVVSCIEEHSASCVEDPTMVTQYSTPKEPTLEVEAIHIQQQPVKLRKSLSTGNLRNTGNIHSENIEVLSHLNLNSSSYHFKRNKGASKERINQLAKPKEIHGNYTNSKKSTALCCTIPQSPALGTKHRQRNNHVLSTEEMELQEMEEYKKLQMKPLPLNPKILQGPMKPMNIYKKPATVVKPFNLTECPTKKTEQIPNNNTDVQTKHQVNKPQPTKPNASVERHRKPTLTRPTPFSFEARDKLIVKRREGKINQILEEEKKAREFRAQPLPKYQFTGTVKKSSSLNSLRSTKSEDESKDPSKVFKAKPPTVLYQKPFQPKKPERPLVEVTEFCLNTERRAKNRQEYDKRVQEKLDRLAIQKLRREEEQKRLEQEEAAALRKETIHSAQPIRQYKEVQIKPSGNVTVPVSPTFRTAKRLNSNNKENAAEIIID